MILHAATDQKLLARGNSHTVLKTSASRSTASIGEKCENSLLSSFSALRKVQSFRNIQEEEVEVMIKKVSESALEQSPLDLSKTFFSLSASIICRLALGQNFNESDFVIGNERIEELVNEALLALGSLTCSDLFPGGLGRFLDWLFGGQKRIDKVFEELDAFYQHVIDDHLAGSETVDSSADIVALLLDIIGKQGNKYYFKLNIDNIKGVLMVKAQILFYILLNNLGIYLISLHVDFLTSTSRTYPINYIY